MGRQCHKYSNDSGVGQRWDMCHVQMYISMCSFDIFSAGVNINRWGLLALLPTKDKFGIHLLATRFKIWKSVCGCPTCQKEKVSMVQLVTLAESFQAVEWTLGIMR